MKRIWFLRALFLTVLLLIVGIIVLGGILYYNRGKIASKLVDYTVQGITGIRSGDNEDDRNTWVENLINTGSETMKNAVFDAVTKRGFDIGNDKPDEENKPSLATMADMFANGTNGNGASLNQMAQALVNSLGAGTGNKVRPQEAGINIRDEHGRTPLMNICRVDVTPRVIKILFKYPVDINAVDENGRTALMYAAALGENPEIVTMLLKYGANPRIRDKNGRTAYDLAKDPAVKKLLPR